MGASQTIRPEAYSPKEAGVVLGIGQTLLFQLLREKKLEARKLGRKTLILRSDVERFLANLPTEVA